MGLRILSFLLFFTSWLCGAPRIVEFSAAGQGVVQDDGDDFPDWLEILHEDEESYSLTDHYLTNDPDALSLWKIPRGTTLKSGQRWVVYASGKDRTNIFQNAVHSNFTLEKSRGYLALVAPDGEKILSEWRDYPSQRPGISYGEDDGGGIGYFAEMTPGEGNGVAFAEKVADTKFSVRRGFYEDPIMLTIATATEGAAIYVTLDGSEPSVSLRNHYTDAIPISSTTIVRAMAVKAGQLSTNIDTHSYLFVESVLTQPKNPDGFPNRWGPVSADYGFDRSVGSDDDLKSALLDYPSVSLVMPIDSWFGRSTEGGVGGIYANSTRKGLDWEKVVSAEFLNFEGSNNAQVDCGIRIYGNASRQTSRPKHNLRLAFRARYGPSKLNFPVFGKGKATGINGLLFNGQNGDSWFHPASGQREAASYIRDHFAHEMLGEMGHLTPPQSRAHVYVNGLYWGFYQTVERVDQHSMARMLGGEPEEYDSMKASIQEGPTLVAGDTRSYEKLYEVANAGVEDDDSYTEIQQYLNLNSFIDYMMINFWTGNRDWDGNNWRSGRHRSPGSPWHYFMWDSENIFKDTGIDKTGSNTANNPTRLHQQLVKNPQYRLKFADHVHKHLFNGGLLTEAAVKERWLRWAGYVRSGLLAESARWSDHHREGRPYTLDEDYQENLDFVIESMIPARARNALRQFESRDLYPRTVPLVSFNQHGGRIEAGFRLTLKAGTIFHPLDGDILYTLDASDPMANGMVYDDAIILTKSTTVYARARSNSGEWSPRTEARFAVGLLPQQGEIVLSEIHYHPAKVASEEGPEQQWSRTDFEFIEVWNRSARTLQLEGMALTEGVRYLFPEASLLPGQRVVIAEDEAAFATRYGNVSVIGKYTGQLSNGGEQLTLTGAEGQILDTVFYDDEGAWPASADGDGYSLVLDGASQWSASPEIGGSPGRTEQSTPTISVVWERETGHFSVSLSESQAEAEVLLQQSGDLMAWAKAEGGVLVSGEGVTRRWRLPVAPGATRYYRAQITAKAQ